MPGEGFRLDAAVADVYGDLRLAPVLRRLLRHSGRLTGSGAGSISLVDAARGQYVKAAEIGARCRLGQRFPLDEGATGAAFGRRRPVVIPDYGRLRAGHLAGTDPASRGAAVAVPIWWRGDVIAVDVVFAPDASEFGAGAVDNLEALAQTAAAAIVMSGRHDPSLAALIARRVPATVIEAGAVRPVSPAVARTASDLVAAAARTINDDVAVQDSTYTVGRCGVAGNFFVIKAVGAASEQGADLDEVIRIGRKVNDVTRTMGVALTACTPPAKGSPLFELGADEMEFGVGIHGEPGRERRKLKEADAIVDDLLEAVVTDLPYNQGDRVALMINGLGGTPISELYILFRRAHQRLADRGITVGRSYVNEYCTSLDMAGASLTLVRLDDEIEGLLEAPAEAAVRVF